MAEIVVLTEAELRQCVGLDQEAIAIVEQGFSALAEGRVVMPPILSMAIEAARGEVDVKTAYVPGLDGFAIKVSPGFFDNPKLGLPSLNGLMILFNAKTGIVQALLLDNGYLTDVRTAAAGAIAARYLAPNHVQTVGVFGAGEQARWQVRALAQVRDFRRVLVMGYEPGESEAYAQHMSDELGLSVEVAPSAEECVHQSQVVITATPSKTPLIQAEWLHPGLHITAMGSDAAGKNELDPRIPGRADRFVCDRRSQSETVGELRSALAAGTMDNPGEVDEIGMICRGDRPGRLDEQAITVCDLTGTGIQDTAIATHAFQAARKAGLGHTIQS